MIQHCLQCDRPMHLRGGDMTTTCAECRVTEHPLPRSEAHDLDARALRARLEDRERVIAAFRERIQEVEQALYWVREESDNRANVIAAQTHNLNVLNEHIKKLEAVAEAAGDLQLHWTARQWNALQRALEALDAKEGG